MSDMSQFLGHSVAHRLRRHMPATLYNRVAVRVMCGDEMVESSCELLRDCCLIGWTVS